MATAAALRAEAAALVAALTGQQVGADVATDGRAGGRHRGLRRGGGVEFAEHRLYAPGDDLRRLDWRALARTDRLFVKQVEQEVHNEVILVVDGSASMHLVDAAEGGGVDKWWEARVLACAIALLVTRQGDGVGLWVPGRPEARVPSASGSPHRLIERLAALAPEGEPGLASLDPRDLGRVAPGAVWILISDGLCAVDALRGPLTRVRRVSGSAVLLHTLHPLEARFTFSDAVDLVCAERGSRQRVEPRVVRQRYLAMMQEHADELRDLCVDTGVHYVDTVLGEGRPEALRSALQRGRR